jgi:hypothetical protein
VRPFPPRRALWRLALPALALLALAPAAVAAPPSADELRDADARLEVRERALAGRLTRLHADLVDGRARLDEARRRNRLAQRGLVRRLTAIYVRPEPAAPLLEMILGASLGEAQEQAELLESIGRRDRDLVARSRRAAAELRAAEEILARRRVELTAVRRSLGVDRALVRSRLAAAIQRERAAAEERAAAAGGTFTVTGPTGLPVAFGEPVAPSQGRGLPGEFLHGRRLPGSAPRDAATGRPIDVRPAPAGPQATRAYPGIGVVGPATGLPIEGNLPTFTAVAGWYGPDARGVRTASGEAYDPAAFSAASRTLGFGTLLRVGYGGRVVTVKVNDRGPYVRGRDLDLSEAAAAVLGLPGVGTVTVQILPDPGARTA